MLVLKSIVVALLVLAVLVVMAGQFGLLSGNVPGDLGVKDGKLKRPSKTPNSVSSQADAWAEHPQREAARIAPLALVGGSGEATIARLKTLLQSWPGASIVESRADYLRVQFTTRLMKYVDDAEFWFDPAAGVVQLRSASRVGRKDFDVNRERVEALRAKLATP